MTETLSFTRHDLTSSSTALPRGMCVYPVAKKAHQRIVMADRTGGCTVFGIGARLNRVHVFDVAESDTEAAIAEEQRKAPIACLTLFSDQLFLMRGSMLMAYSRKGKLFFHTDTHVTETVRAIFIATPYIFLAGEYMATTLKETKELGFYMSSDKINTMTVFVSNKGLRKQEMALDDYICCLGCHDRVLRLVQDNKLLEEVYCEAPITALHVDVKRRLLFYGTQVGSMGVFALTDRVRRVLQCVPGQSPAANGVTPKAPAGTTSAVQAAITCLSTADVNCDEANEVLVGYDDGTVRVLSAVPPLTSTGQMPPGETALDELWIARLGEAIMSIGGGVVTRAPTHPDVVVHLFSGPLVAFTLDRNESRRESAVDGDDARRAALEAEAVRGKTEDTRQAIEALQKRIAQRTAELSKRSGATRRQAPMVAVASTFTSEVSLSPIPGTAMLSLVVQADVPLSHVVLRSVAEVGFLGTESTLVTPQPLPVLTPAERRASAALGAAAGRTLSLAVAYPLLESQAPDAGGRRLEVRLWADEGQAEQLSVTLYALPSPRTAQLKRVRLCALPLYSRVASIQSLMRASEAPYALSQLVLSGTFPADHVQVWLSHLLPDVRESYEADRATAALTSTYFASEFLQSVLIIEKEFSGGLDGASHADGTAAIPQLTTISFTSDSLSALATIRRVVASLASMSGFVVSWKENILFGSAARRLAQLEPVMQHCSDARRRALLLDGLREIQTDEGELADFLPSHLQTLMSHPDEVMAEASRQEQEERYLKRAVVQLYASLVGFLFHAPALSPSLREKLESAACGVSHSQEALIKLVFPKNEHIRERERLQAANLAAQVAPPDPTGAPQSELPSLNVSDAAGVEVSSESDKE